MRHLTILVDMDDTIENLAEAWVDYLNARHQTSTSLSDITDWDISKVFPTLTKEQVYAPLFEDAFWSWVKPMKGASETLQKLIADGHTVLIVTTSNYQTLAAKMEQVLFRYFPFLTWNDVIITAHKQLIKGDVLIDDGIHNLEGGDYFKILMTAPHNRNYDADKNGMYRVSSWSDAYSAIQALACADSISKWQDDPAAFAEEVLHIQLKSYQRLALRLKGGLNRIENHSVFNRLSQV